MTSVREHYQNHLASVYSWMCGDLETAKKEFSDFFRSLNYYPENKVALDLGAGHGIQSLAMAELGFEVTSVDLNTQLLAELSAKDAHRKIRTLNADIRDFRTFDELKPSVLICAGDTLTHLENYNQIEQFLENCCETLIPGGLLILSFRDYSQKLNGNSRFIPVKSDENRIMTCFLEYFPTTVRVTDIIHERRSTGWEQKISSYDKFRISDTEATEILHSCKMRIVQREILKGMTVIVAEK